jgi:transposase
VRVGMEATGYSRWFERLLAELGIQVWIGDAAEIKRKRVRKQKTDRLDAQLLLKLLLENNFPEIWIPSPENRDLRQLLWHRHRLVQMRTRIMNQLQALAMNEGKRWKKKLWSAQRARTARKAPVGSLGQPAPTRLAGVTGPHESDHRGVNRRGGARSPEVARSAATDDAP